MAPQFGLLDVLSTHIIITIRVVINTLGHTRNRFFAKLKSECDESKRIGPLLNRIDASFAICAGLVATGFPLPLIGAANLEH